MTHELASILEEARQALALLLDRTVGLDVYWAGLGLVLYEVAQVVRTRGWFNILRATFPNARELRARDVAGAHLAGSGLNSMLPARAGDILKLAMIRRRAPEARYCTLAATFIPETIFETFCGTALVIWALAHGFLPIPLSPGDLPQVDVSLVITHPLLCGLSAALSAVVLVPFTGWLRRRGSRFGLRIRHGLVILREPRSFVTGVATWQALSRLIRLAGLACFMTAFGLPVTARTAILVMAAQGAGRIVPLAPVSAGLRVAMLSYGFVEVTDEPIDVASVTSFWFTVGAAHLVASVLLAVVILAITFRIVSPRRAITGLRLLRVGGRVVAPQPDPGPSPLPNEG
jgi:hypothetical protein